MFRARIYEPAVWGLLEKRLGAVLGTYALTKAVLMWLAGDAMTIDADTVQIAAKLRSSRKILWQSELPPVCP